MFSLSLDHKYAALCSAQEEDAGGGGRFPSQSGDREEEEGVSLCEEILVRCSLALL